jgi:hypothetical protein
MKTAKKTDKDVEATNELLDKLVNRIIRTQQMLSAIDEITSHLRNTHRGYGTEIDSGNIRDLLYADECKAWRDLCMWGLTVDNTVRDRIKAAVYGRYLSNNFHVADWLTDHGGSPGTWLKADEEAFRKLAKRMFAPKGEEGEK